MTSSIYELADLVDSLNYICKPKEFADIGCALQGANTRYVPVTRAFNLQPEVEN